MIIINFTSDSEAVEHGWEPVGAGSLLALEYRSHGLELAPHHAGNRGQRAYIPTWLHILDGNLYHRARTQEYCSLCATIFIYSNLTLNKKWSVLMTLDEYYLGDNLTDDSSGYKELLQDLRDNGFVEAPCNKVNTKHGHLQVH